MLTVLMSHQHGEVRGGHDVCVCCALLRRGAHNTVATVLADCVSTVQHSHTVGSAGACQHEHAQQPGTRPTGRTALACPLPFDASLSCNELGTAARTVQHSRDTVEVANVETVASPVSGYAIRCARPAFAGNSAETQRKRTVRNCPDAGARPGFAHLAAPTASDGSAADRRTSTTSTPAAPALPGRQSNPPPEMTP